MESSQTEMKAAAGWALPATPAADPQCGPQGGPGGGGPGPCALELLSRSGHVLLLGEEHLGTHETPPVRLTFDDL